VTARAAARRKRDPRRIALVSAPGDTSAEWSERLGALGYAVERLADPTDLGGAAPPALVVVDDRRARAERLEALARLRAQPALVGVPLLVVSEDCGIDSFGGAIARGASAFVRSPLDPAELRDAVLRLAAWRDEAPPAGASPVRRGRRRPLLLGVDVDVPGRGLARALMVDASASGCRLEMDEPVDAFTTLGIIPRACEDSTEIRLAGTVQWSRPARGGHWVAVRWTGTAGVLARRILGLAAVAPQSRLA
jgi:CheY-like chemotaxis protein